MIKRSCKGSDCIGYLRQQIDEIEYHHGYTWNDLISNGWSLMRNMTLSELENDGQKLKQLKRNIPKSSVKSPSAIQVILEDTYQDTVEEVEENIKNALELSRLQTGLEFELALFAYLEDLKDRVMHVGKIEDSDKTEDMTGPEMVKTLVEILMLNRDQDKEVIAEVKAALLKWEV